MRKRGQMRGGKAGAPRLPRHLKKRRRVVASVTESEFFRIKRVALGRGFTSIAEYLRHLIDNDLARPVDNE